MDILSASNGALLGMALYLLIFWPTVGNYVYQDSKKRNLSSPYVRGFVSGFFGVLGAIAHFLPRGKSESPAQ